MSDEADISGLPSPDELRARASAPAEAPDISGLPSKSELVMRAAENTPQDDALHRNVNSLVDVPHAMLSGTYHQIVGGYKGIGAMMRGEGMDKAADAVNRETSQAYEAPDSALNAALSSKYNPLNYQQEALDKLADDNADHGGSPLLSTALHSLPAIAAAVTGVGGLARSIKRNPDFYFLRTPKPPPPEPRKYTAQEAVQESGLKQSMGADKTVPDTSQLPQELQQAIADAGTATGGNINQTALERHLDTAQLAQPEGSSPLYLRAGQAANDAQQISDEKNFRNDPATLRILSDSIDDQDRKLVSSVGEIRRRATPDVVQRNNLEHGQAAINAIKEEDNRALTDIKAKYQALADANGGYVPIDPRKLHESIFERLDTQGLDTLAEGTPELAKIQRTLIAGRPIPFKTYEAWRTNLAELQRGRGNLGVAAGIFRDELEKMPLSDEAAHMKGLADQARSAAKARFDKIEANPAYAAVVDDNVPRVGGLHDLSKKSPLAGSFMDDYFLGGSESADREYITRLKDAVRNPELSKAIEGATLNKLRDAALNDPLAEQGFRTDRYRQAVNSLQPKHDVLMSPETIENVERLKRVAGYVKDEPVSSTTNRSNTALTLMRHGAIFPKDPSMAQHLFGVGADVLAGHLGPAGVLGKHLLERNMKQTSLAKAEKSKADAILSFAREATRPGAGLEFSRSTGPHTPRIERATGGKVDEDALVRRLTSRWKNAKHATDATTKPLLSVPDAAIIRALDIAQEHL